MKKPAEPLTTGRETLYFTKEQIETLSLADKKTLWLNHDALWVQETAETARIWESVKNREPKGKTRGAVA